MLQNVLSELRNVLARDMGEVYLVIGASVVRYLALGVISLFTHR